MNSERIAAWYAAMANYIPLWKKGSERLANTQLALYFVLVGYAFSFYPGDYHSVFHILVLSLLLGHR